MSELNHYKLSELYEMSSGISTTPEQAGHGSPFLSFSSVFRGHFLPEALPDQMDTSDKEQKTYSVREGDIFLTRTSETLDELGMSSVAYQEYPHATYSGFLKRLRPTQTDKAYHKFMAFYLRSKLFRKTMDNNAVMTLRCSLNEQIFSYLDVLLPDWDDQVKIGDLLFLVYEKIELNNQINAELEAMAKLLYDYWFVQFDFPMTAEQASALGQPELEGKPYKTSGGKMVFNSTLKRDIPEGWENGTLGDYFEIKSGFPFKSSDYTPEGRFQIVTIKNVQDRNLDLSSTEKIDLTPVNLPTYCTLKSGSILMSLTGNVARSCVVFCDNLLLNQRVGLVIPVSGRSSHVNNLIKSQEVFSKLVNAATGSNQKNLSPIEATKIRTVRAGTTTLDQYEKYTSSSFDLIIQNQKQNQELTELRDWLLPMLMNGQVTVTG
tara:strand:+ start:7182 stop:8483 length:1302 start_codon:yes stop_codon:yes gene_type:complete